MPSNTELISQRSLIHRPVLEESTLTKLGQIEVMWSYPPVHRVYGFVCKAGLLGNTKLAIKLPQIVAIDDRGVIIRGQAEPTQASKVRQLPSLINAEVWTEGGKSLGKIVDYRFDQQSGLIAHYLFVAGDWAGLGGDLYRLSPRKIASLEDNRVLVPDVAVPKLKIDQEGFQHIFEDAGDILQETYAEMQRDLRRLSRRTQRLTALAKGQFQSLTEQAKEKASVVGEQLRDEVQTIAHEAKEVSQTVTEQVKERTQSLTEQAKEVGQSVGAPMQERTQERATPDPDEPEAIADDPLDSHPPIPDSVERPPGTLDDEWLWEDEWDDEPSPPPKAEPKPSTPPSKPTAPPSADDDDEPWI